MVKLLYLKRRVNKKGEPNGSPFCCGDAGNRTLVQTRNLKAFYMFSKHLIFEYDREAYIPKTKPYPFNFASRSRHPYRLVHPFDDARWDRSDQPSSIRRAKARLILD